METLFTSPSYPLLFLLSFLAATILPIGSEWLLIVMVVKGFSPEYSVLTASFGNYLGACTTLLIGIWGSDFCIRKVLRIDDTQLTRAKRLYGKYGTWSLLFSWLPIVGDPLCLIAGIFRVNFFRFSILVYVGKFFRYAILALLALNTT
jgi:membrane protein YqaA with SNARE-associated domain